MHLVLERSGDSDAVNPAPPHMTHLTPSAKNSENKLNSRPDTTKPNTYVDHIL